MLHLHPTTITLTSSELKDVENRSRYRRYLRTQYRKSTPHPKATSRNDEALVSASPTSEHINADSPTRSDGAPISTTRSTTPELHGEEDEIRTESDTEVQNVVPSTTTSELSLLPPRSTWKGVLFHRRPVSGKAVVDQAYHCNPNEVLDAYSDAETEADVESDDVSAAQSSGNGSPAALRVVRRPGPRDLPPPFSAVPRDTSSVRRQLRQASDLVRHSEMASVSLPQNHSERRVGSPSRAHRIMSAVRSLGARATRSPSRQPSVYDNIDVSNLSVGEILTASMEPRARTPLLPVYNDSLPRTVQPQTPRHLPESRHQSRFVGAYTAPAESLARNVPEVTPTRPPGRQVRRNRSPIGVLLPGLLGLYGGSENADDQQ